MDTTAPLHSGIPAVVACSRPHKIKPVNIPHGWEQLRRATSKGGAMDSWFLGKEEPVFCKGLVLSRSLEIKWMVLYSWVYG